MQKEITTLMIDNKQANLVLADDNVTVQVIYDGKTLHISGGDTWKNYNAGNIKDGYELLNIQVTSFRKYEVELLEYVTNPKLVDIDLLPTGDEVKKLLMTDPTATELIVDKLVRVYRKKVEFLREMQSGIKIYKYDYLKQHGVKLGR